MADSSGADKRKDSVDSSNGGGVADCNVCFEPATDPVVTLCGHLYCWPCLYRWLRSGHNNCPVCKAGVTKENVIPLYGRGNDRVDPRTKKTDSAESRPGWGSSSSSSSSSGQSAGSGGSSGASGGNSGGDESVPNRPSAQRPTPTATDFGGVRGAVGGGGGGGWAGGNNGGVSFSAGFGFFPSLFGLQFQTFNLGGGSGSANGPNGAGNNRHPQRPLTPEEQNQIALSRMLFFVGTFIVLFLMML